MSYLGQVELKSSEIRRIDVTGSTSATHTLTWTPPSEQSLIITINGVKQQNNYSFSGTTLTLDTALIVTDAMEVIGILDIGEAVTPPDDSISTIKIQDDAVTAAKLANSINTEITANTAKVTNATHTGDVTGATALTIATDAVDIAMLSATGVADATTFLRGDNAWAAAGGGKVVQMVKMSDTTQASTTNTSMTDTSLTLSITPASSSNILIVICNWSARTHQPGTADVGGQYRLYNSTDSVALAEARTAISGSSTNWDVQFGQCYIGYDTGRSVATTYILQMMASISGSTVYVNGAVATTGSLIIMELEP